MRNLIDITAINRQVNEFLRVHDCLLNNNALENRIKLIRQKSKAMAFLYLSALMTFAKLRSLQAEEKRLRECDTNRNFRPSYK